MTNLPAPILQIFSIFAPLFSKPVYKNALLLFVGHILTKGRRTVADLLRTLNLKNVKNFSKFHWVLSGAKWDSLSAARVLFLLILKFIPSEDIFINMDTTLERRKGPKIHGLARHRDAARSTKSNKVLSIGLNWLVSAINIRFPCSTTKWSLPFLTILMPPEKTLRSSRNKKDLDKKYRHKKMTVWARQVVYVIRRWAGKSKKITLVADSAFACFDIAYACISNNMGLISKLRMDARLYDFIPENYRKRKGRVAGKVLPKLSQIAKTRIEEWEKLSVQWYGGATKTVFIKSGKCLWYYVGFRPVSIHWVLIKEHANSEPMALFSTDLTHTPQKIIEAYVERWPLEVTFEETRRHLGMETQRQWSDEAIKKTTPIILASFSIITLMGWELSRLRKEKIPLQSTSWYEKNRVTFSDVLAYVREAIFREKYNSLLGEKGDRRMLDIEDFIIQAAAA